MTDRKVYSPDEVLDAYLAGRDRHAEVLARLELWALTVETFIAGMGHDYVEGFRDAQRVVLGMIQADMEPSSSAGSERG